MLYELIRLRNFYVMKKSLLDLTTREFTALLLNYSPIQDISVLRIGGNKPKEDLVKGSYIQLLSSTSVNPEVNNIIKEKLFDYDMAIGHLEMAQYLRYRTNDYDSDLSEALFCDIDEIGGELMLEMEEQGVFVEKDKIGNNAGTFMYQAALHTLGEAFTSKKENIVTNKNESNQNVITEVNRDRAIYNIYKFQKAKAYILWIGTALIMSIVTISLFFLFFANEDSIIREDVPLSDKILIPLGIFGSIAFCSGLALVNKLYLIEEKYGSKLSEKKDIVKVLRKENNMPSANRPFNIPKELDTPQGIIYLKRLTAFCDEYYRWKDKTQKTKMCQVAHILGGLLNIPNNRKWKPFEDLWEVEGLANAYNKRNGRPLDKEIKDIFPEYEGF